VSIYLAADHRRRGLGTQLVQRCIEHAPRIGVTTLVGLIFGHNDPSLGLFEKMGFSRWGYLPRVAVLDGVERDLVIVGRRV
jgi:phosphinothricin acetyltransferase